MPSKRKKKPLLTMPSKRKKKATASSSSSKSASPKKLKLTEELSTEEAQKSSRRADTLNEPRATGSGQRSEEDRGAKKSRDSKLKRTEGETQKSSRRASGNGSDDEADAKFIGKPVPPEEARQRWPKRYEKKKGKKVVQSERSTAECASDEVIQARCHYTIALVDGRVLYNLYDDAHVHAGNEEEANYICKIVEMFESVDGTPYFTAQWYYRGRDTVIEKAFDINPKRVFYSEVQDDNPLDCLIEKLNIERVPLNVDLEAKRQSIPVCDYYCDALYLLPYSTFMNLPEEKKLAGSETSSTISSEIDINEVSEVNSKLVEDCKVEECNEATLLDIYSGCGAMSTGLCVGAQLSGLNLVTKWAVDLNEHACDSLKLNHPETEVRNEAADDYLSLLKEWQKLCVYFDLIRHEGVQPELDIYFDEDEEEEDDDESSNEEDDSGDSEIFEVEKILAICYGDPKKTGKRGLYFKVHWKGYTADDDTWEPIQGLGNCKERIKRFVTDKFKLKSLPLPGDVDVICGGPPCQGISGFNRFRDKDNPLNDEKNKQLLVFMDFVQFLKPKYVLMENVVDLVKFSDGYLGRYALGRLVEMNYQVRMGLMAAGAYGLPQFRMRVFLWGAQPAEILPSLPLPTHDVVVRGVIPNLFEVDNFENRDEMPYNKQPITEFQQLIRLSKDELLSSPNPSKQLVLYDHQPLILNSDDYQRVCRIPKRKGANFRDLPGVRVRPDNIVEWDPNVERVYLDSGKPLVPDYAMSFVKGSSSKPFRRLWWDETVPTVVTRAEPHNQAILHPEQDRVLTIRENARLQGFPDYYKLSGPVKERYIQVGNAVAVPVSRALGYTLGLAYQGRTNNEALFKLPPKFPDFLGRLSSTSSETDS
ncbi:hypothetical protein FNV43_RR14124 [Rhamnella rubrinervis]|uniref:Cytosine-specific methyltransferase n=1 Tax=Rhamnella rubrinervis TaxID=2594499 RepID=A0A8K0H2D9_9ROSA|nr:hypothetical protein FNV43_RR14124 [Rhamnella rubrinervis]